jgi:hypothetical protein
MLPWRLVSFKIKKSAALNWSVPKCLQPRQYNLASPFWSLTRYHAHQGLPARRTRGYDILRLTRYAKDARGGRRDACLARSGCFSRCRKRLLLRCRADNPAVVHPRVQCLVSSWSSTSCGKHKLTTAKCTHIGMVICTLALGPATESTDTQSQRCVCCVQLLYSDLCTVPCT